MKRQLGFSTVNYVGESGLYVCGVDCVCVMWIVSVCV